MKKYNYSNFYFTVKALEDKYNHGLTNSIRVALNQMNETYLAMMKRKTTADVDVEALDMIIEMATLAKEHLENNEKKA